MKPLVTSVLAALLTIAWACKERNASSPTTTTTSTTAARSANPVVPATKQVTVALLFTGAGILSGTTLADRVYVVPNFSKENPMHTPLLLAIPDMVVADLTDKREQLQKGQTPGQGDTYLYREIPPGYEIDLPRSGWTLANNPSLSLDESGDNTAAQCPDSTTVKRTSLHWLPRLSTVSQESPYTLKDDFIKSAPSADAVVTRLAIAGGILDVSLTSSQRKFQFTRRNVPAADDVVQTVSSYLRYTFVVDLDANNPVFTLMGHKFGTDGSQASDRFEYGQFKPNGNNRIEISLANLPVEEFFAPRLGAALQHFPLYYKMIDGSPMHTLPIVKGKCPSIAVGAVIECAPVRP